MTDRVKTWVDLGYKWAVMIGSVAMVVANLKFASKDDLTLAKAEIQASIATINTTIAVTNQSITQAVDLIKRLETVEHDHESRLRSLENRVLNSIK